MWLDLNGSPSLNYIHFTCHLVCGDRRGFSPGGKKEDGTMQCLGHITQLLAPVLQFTNGPSIPKAQQTDEEGRSAKTNRTSNEVVKIVNPLLPNLSPPPASTLRTPVTAKLLKLSAEPASSCYCQKTHLQHFTRRKRKLPRACLHPPAWLK